MASERSPDRRDGKIGMALSETLKHLNDCVESDEYVESAFEAGYRH